MEALRSTSTEKNIFMFHVTAMSKTDLAQIACFEVFLGDSG